jgi:GntR family transcriptional regulator/MocR family aminotransferase
LLARAAEHQALVIEDDYGGEFRFGRGPIDTLRSMDREGRVFYVGTFSSSLLPALRIGFIVAPDWALEALVAARAASDWHGPALEQGTLAAFISEGHLARHIRRMRKVYANRHAALMSALQDHCTDRLRPALGASGLHVAAFLRGRADLPLWKRRAALAGIRVETLDEFALTPSGPAGFALGFGLIEAARIPDAVRRLAEAAP